MKTVIRVTMLGALLAACADGPFDPDRDRGWMVATIEGSVVDSYEGDGRFGLVYQGGQGGDDIFEIRSVDVRRGGSERIIFERFGAQRPAAGRYWLDDYDGFFARYELYRNGRWEWYVADIGALDIWSATSERIEGEFRFSAALACVGDGYTMECGIPPEPDAPRILVEGSFLAVSEGSYYVE